MIDDPVLLNDWHVVARSGDATAGKVLSARLLGQDLVLWRNQGDGALCVLAFFLGTRAHDGHLESTLPVGEPGGGSAGGERRQPPLERPVREARERRPPQLETAAAGCCAA